MKRRCQCANDDGYFVSSELVHVSSNDCSLSRCQLNVVLEVVNSCPARVDVGVGGVVGVVGVVGGP